MADDDTKMRFKTSIEVFTANDKDVIEEQERFTAIVGVKRTFYNATQRDQWRDMMKAKISASIAQAKVEHEHVIEQAQMAADGPAPSVEEAVATTPKGRGGRKPRK